MAVQCAFHKKFKLKRHDSVPLCVTIGKWVKRFWETSAATSIGAVEKMRSVRTVENCKKMRVAVEVAQQTSDGMLWARVD